MGNTWEVYAWIKAEDEFKYVKVAGEYQRAAMDEFKYVQVYAGESQRDAMEAARSAKANGCKCVKIEWRG